MCLSGTDEYICYVVKTYSQTMLRAAYSILRNTHDSEDAVQEALLKLIKSRPAFDSKDHEKAWLIKVTMNIAKNMLKHSRMESTYTEVTFQDGSAENSHVLAAVLSLPKKYRAVIHLYYYEGYSIKETAAILNMPSATVGTILSRGRKKLKELLKGEENL